MPKRKPYTITPVDQSEENEEILTLLHEATFPDCDVYPLTDSYWWFANDPKGCPIGFAGLTPSTIEGGGYMCRAGVLKAHRGHGLQMRLIKARIAKARALKLRYLVTDTVAGNAVSANHLIQSGFRLYNPITPWGSDGSLYWRKELN